MRLPPSAPDHHDFLPALQAIEHTAPHPLPRLMIAADRVPA